MLLTNLLKKVSLNINKSYTYFCFLVKLNFGKKLYDMDDPELSKIPLFFISAFHLQKILQNIKPEYTFQEKDFLNELQLASLTSRGKK